MKPLMLGLLALASAASATDLRIYPDFTEFREAVTVPAAGYTFTLPASAWGQVVPGSVDLEGITVASRVEGSQGSWLNSLEGQSVTLIENGVRSPVTLVRAQDLLIKDAQGSYRTVDYGQLAFPSLPPLNAGAKAQGVRFNVAGGGSGVLSYLSRAVSWSPRYSLKVAASGAASLSALADIRNNSEQAYRVNTTELFAGEVQLSGGRPMPYAMRSEAADAVAAAPAPKINSLGELRGLYRYALSTPFDLPAGSTVSLPFLQPKVSFERYASLNLGFSPQGGSGKLDRAYRLTADALLPAGVVTVRDEGRVVGQANISDTAKGDPLELDLGSDPDVAYTRTVQVLRQDKTTAVVKVTLTLTNAKDRPIRAEVTENLGGGDVSVEGATKVPEGLLLKVDLPAKGKVTRSYTVTVKNQ